jgi:tetratricopeptide (TPR) repeat protein
MKTLLIAILAFLLTPARSGLADDRGAQIALLRADAQALLARGDFAHARARFDELLVLAPDDAGAARDAGRAAMAAGDLAYAARVLEHAHHSGGHHRDPELHYLRGEALYALGSVAEAYQEHRIAELEMGSAPSVRMRQLWLGRIYARRGQLDRADLVYESLWPADDQAPDPEISINHADAHLLASDWTGAARILRRFLARAPDNLRARLMLAWALEASGDLDAELVVRAHLAAEQPSAAIQQDYGRALERGRDYRHALVAYQSATNLAGNPDASLAKARDRMRDKTTPEVGANIMLRSDPASTMWHLQGGVALPFGSRHLASLLAWHDLLHGGFPVAHTSVTGAVASLLLGTRWGGTIMLGGQAWAMKEIATDDGQLVRPAGDLQLGGVSEIDTPLGQRLRLNLHGELRNQWVEAPIAAQEGGSVTGVIGHLFVMPLRFEQRLVIDSGAQARQLSLAPRERGVEPKALQLLAWVGADVVLWHDPARVLNGESLDDRLVYPTELADSVALSYRHYELFGRADDTFATRIGLVDRSSVDMGSFVVRNALDGGRLGFDFRVGMGYDRRRTRALWQLGTSLFTALTARTRLGIAYDIAQESATGLTGTRQTGWLSFHADI